MKITKHISVIQNGLNSIVLSKNGKAWVFFTPTVNHDALVTALQDVMVERVICLNYRASLHGGLTHWLSQGAKLAVPRAQVGLFTHPGQVADAEVFHQYSFHPDADVLPDPVHPDMLLNEDSALDFEGIRLYFATMKGDTLRELMCVIEDEGRRIAVCGDVLCDDGKIPFLHRMTVGGFVGAFEYHSFLQAKNDFIQSIQALKTADVLVPARGEVTFRPASTVRTVTRRIEALYDNFSSSCSLRYYGKAQFPTGKFSEVKARTTTLPSFVLQNNISYLVVSKNKRGILVDCGKLQTVDWVVHLLKEGRLAALDACFITHYHDDHVDFVNELRRKTGCRVWSTSSQADVLKHPWRYRLPALSEESTEIEVLPNERPFEWEGMTLTAFDFPGQSLHHGALLVEHRKKRYLFCGDSFAPSGFDDYCAGNRNFLSGNRGYFICLKLLEKHRPDWLLNQHILTPFHFSKRDIATLRQRLTRRKALMKAISPWQGIDMATDPTWVRLMPEEPTFAAGGTIRASVQVTSHVANLTDLVIRFDVPCGMTAPKALTFKLNGYTCGFMSAGKDSDLVADVSFDVPRSFRQERVSIAAHAWLGGTYCGTVGMVTWNLR